jgi:UDP-3-O-[3-hydroxymyristoyl] N-acetylglucosamine deacetylase
MKERTIKDSIEFSGVGVHTGEESKIVLEPAETHGIIFVKNGVEIPGTLDSLKFRDREVTLSKNGEEVRTVEHLMSAFYACEIDHLKIIVEDDEIPALDGSAYPFISKIEAVGTKELKKEKEKSFINSNIAVEDKGCYAYCGPFESLKIHYIISYNHPLLRYQEYVFNGMSNFKEDIARCRTYGFLSWKKELNRRGYALGASEENTLVYTEDGMLNEAQFPDEAVKHKITDLIGELYLIKPVPIGEYFVFRGGHLLHLQLIKEIKRRRDEIRY